MLVPEFWQWFGWILAGLCVWCVAGLLVALFFGAVCKCGVDHSEQCELCSGRGFHKDDCPIMKEIQMMEG